jgi:subtilisin
LPGGLLGLACSLTLLSSPVAAAPLDDRAAPMGARIPNHYIVVLEDSVEDPGAVARAQTASHGGRVGFVYRYALKGYSAVLSKAAVEALRSDPRVKFVTPDSVGEGGAQTTPRNVKRVFAPNNGNLAINEKEDVYVNADVAVLDSGVEFSHPDINPTISIKCTPPSESLVLEPNYKTCVKGEGIDVHGHGTHVAGTVGALDNNFGVVGVAPGVRITSVQVLNNANKTTQSWFTAGIDWVTEEWENIEVANASIWCQCSWPAVETAIEGAVSRGVVFVTIAGNAAGVNAEKISPAKNPYAITVGAIADYDGLAGSLSATPPCTIEYTGPEKDDSWANFSSWGSVVDVVAPGFCIYSTMKGKTYGNMWGTSMAAPAVAGAAAILAASANPENLADVEKIQETIEEEGNFEWNAEYEGPQQPLLDVKNEAVF